ncbi:MAG: hypothetical protein PHF72_07300 [Gammaproteobacteria bacterium]|nr:hypothetical protein [Gammaproteobacteria bacterium]
MSVLTDFLHRLLRDAVRISWTLFRIMVPVIVAVKVLEELGAVVLLSRLLEPVMAWVGLPGGMGLVWATAMATNLYGGIVVFAALADAAPLSVAQVTVLTGMMLIAHSLPVELRVAQQAGARLRAMLLLRVGGALLFGAIMNLVYTRGGWLQAPAVLLWRPEPPEPGWMAWALGELQGLAVIFAVVVALLLALRVLERVGFIALVNRLLRPLLRLLGIGEQAMPLTLVGMTLGISYGGGLLIAESRAGHVGRLDVLYAMSLLGLCHSLIEDTLLMALLGGHLSGILWARLAFALAVVFLLVRLVGRLPRSIVDRHLVRGPVPARPLAAEEGG